MAGEKFSKDQVQVAAAIEDVNGTAETLTSADVEVRFLPDGTDFVYEPDRTENNEAGDDLAAAPECVVGRPCTVELATQVQTSGAVATKPALGRYLIGCGHVEEQVKSIAIGAPAGGDNAILVGETYDVGGGTKTGLIAVSLGGAGTLLYVPQVGGDLEDLDVLTIGTDGDTATASGASAAYGWRYRPRSAGFKALTLQRAMRNDKDTAALDALDRARGCMGSMVLNWESKTASRWSATYRGVKIASVDGDRFDVVLPAATCVSLVKLVNATIQLNSVAIRPQAITFTQNAEVDLLDDPTTTGGIEGYESADIARRAPTLAVNPFRVPHSELDIESLMELGTLVPFVVICGTTAGDILEFVSPNNQVISSGNEERSRKEVRAIELQPKRGSFLDHDYWFLFR